MKLNRDRRVGNVIFVVEGEKAEFAILQRIFKDLLGFGLLRKKRENVDVLRLSEHNKVAIIRAESSHVGCIENHKFMDDLFEAIIEYGFRPDKSALFFLFDRDPESNTNTEQVACLLQDYQDPYDNKGYGFVPAGMLLLSYPSVEAHLISHFYPTQGQKFALGKELKQHVNSKRKEGCSYGNICEESLLHATDEFIEFYERELGISFKIDEPSHRGFVVFDHQEEHYRTCGKYKLFSHLAQALIYLGVIVLDEELTGGAG